jgi:hypothetical protein
MILEIIIAAVIVGAGAGGYWLGWTHAKEDQADEKQVDRLAELAIEYGRRSVQEKQA